MSGTARTLSRLHRGVGFGRRVIRRAMPLQHGRGRGRPDRIGAMPRVEVRAVDGVVQQMVERVLDAAGQPLRREIDRDQRGLMRLDS